MAWAAAVASTRREPICASRPPICACAVYDKRVWPLPAAPSAEMPVQPHTVTVESKMAELRERIRWGRLDFNAWLAQAATRYEVVAGFLALLELIKERVVIAQQEAVYGEIWLELAAGVDRGA